MSTRTERRLYRVLEVVLNSLQTAVRRLEVDVLQLNQHHLFAPNARIERCHQTHHLALRPLLVYRRIPDLALDDLAAESCRNLEIRGDSRLGLPVRNAFPNFFDPFPSQKLAVGLVLGAVQFFARGEQLVLSRFLDPHAVLLFGSDPSLDS
jgi:hypothetical protein